MAETKTDRLRMLEPLVAEISKLSLNDSTVHVHVSHYAMGELTYDEMMVSLVVTLATEKATLQNALEDQIAENPPPIIKS